MKRAVRRIGSVLLKLLLGFVAFALLYGIAAFLLSRIPVNKNPQKGEVTLFLRSNGVHMDIVVPANTDVKDWTKQIRYEHTKAPDEPEYLAFGWGDRDFYLNTPEWADLKFSTAFNAAFYLGSAIVHTEYENRLTESASCKRLTVSKDDYRRLVSYLERTFETDANGNVIWIAGSGYGDNDTFYVGKGKYSLFKTCNTWTNLALKAANQKAAFWTITDTGILTHYE